MRRTHRNRAFSLIEVMFAFVITFTLILGTTQLTLNSLWSKKESDLHFETTSILFSFIERLKSLPFSSPELQEGTFSQRQLGSLNTLGYICQGQIENVSENIKSVELECFPENSPNKKVRIYLFISRDLGF